MLDTYAGFLTLGVIGAMLLLGVFLRAKVKFFQSYLVPAAILGGVVGFNPHPKDWDKMKGTLQKASNGRTCRKCH